MVKTNEKHQLSRACIEMLRGRMVLFVDEVKSRSLFFRLPASDAITAEEVSQFFGSPLGKEFSADGESILYALYSGRWNGDQLKTLLKETRGYRVEVVRRWADKSIIDGKKVLGSCHIELDIWNGSGDVANRKTISGKNTMLGRQIADIIVGQHSGGLAKQ